MTEDPRLPVKWQPPPRYHSGPTTPLSLTERLSRVPRRALVGVGVALALTVPLGAFVGAEVTSRVWQMVRTDPGHEACEILSRPQSEISQADSLRAVRLLKDSRHKDLRNVGERLDYALHSGDVAAADGVGMGWALISACGRHGYDITGGGY